VKELLSSVLIWLMLLQAGISTLWTSYYAYHRNEIANAHCIQKETENFEKCYGSCYIQKQLKEVKEIEQSESATPVPAIDMAQVLFIHTAYELKPFWSLDPSPAIFSYAARFLTGIDACIFRPPEC
jgi:hypothetical protein